MVRGSKSTMFASEAAGARSEIQVETRASQSLATTSETARRDGASAPSIANERTRPDLSPSVIARPGPSGRAAPPKNSKSVSRSTSASSATPKKQLQKPRLTRTKSRASTPQPSFAQRHACPVPDSSSRNGQLTSVQAGSGLPAPDPTEDPAGPAKPISEKASRSRAARGKIILPP